jgi:hypothetical protein
MNAGLDTVDQHLEVLTRIAEQASLAPAHRSAPEPGGAT